MVLPGSISMLRARTMRGISARISASSSSAFARTELHHLHPGRLVLVRQTFLQRRFEADRLVVLLQQILEGLVGKILKAHALLLRDRFERSKNLVVELHPLALHPSLLQRFWVSPCQPQQEAEREPEKQHDQ